MDYILQLMKLIVILAIFLGATYLVLKQLKSKRINKVSPNRMMQVIDGVTVGMKGEVILLKVGTEYILMSHSGDLMPLSQKEILVPEEDFEALFARETPHLALKSLKDKLVKK